MQPNDIYKGYKVARRVLIGIQYENVFKLIGCSCYTCLPHTAPAAAQTDLKTDAAPGTGTGVPQMDQRLLTNTWPKQGTTISIQENTNKN